MIFFLTIFLLLESDISYAKLLANYKYILNNNLIVFICKISFKIMYIICYYKDEYCSYEEPEFKKVLKTKPHYSNLNFVVLLCSN